MNDLTKQLFMSAAPILILVVFLVVYIMIMRKKNRHFLDIQAQTPEYREELLLQQKRIAVSLDRIATALESEKDVGE